MYQNFSEETFRIGPHVYQMNTTLFLRLNTCFLSVELSAQMGFVVQLVKRNNKTKQCQCRKK